MNTGYAIVECETTGLFADRSDRIVEIAIVQLSPSGEIESTWSTLLNPERDPGPTHVHGIRTAHIEAAPTFSQVAGHIAGLLNDRVLVSHYADFDLGFLRAELFTAGLSDAIDHFSPLCTMRLTHALFGDVGRSLQNCSAAFGLTVGRVHEAMADAMATVHLFSALLTSVSDSTLWQHARPFRTNALWPLTSAQSVAPLERSAQESLPQPFLSRTAATLGPWHTPGLDPLHELEYLALLDRALSDGFLDIDEADDLRGLADHFGFKVTNRSALHHAYFEGLVEAAWADGVLDGAEQQQIETVGRVLNVAPSLIEAAKSAPSQT